MKPGPYRNHSRKTPYVTAAVLQGALVGLAAVVASAAAGAASYQDVVGSIPAQFSASGGSASYSVPIELPSGVAGMQPELTLAYNSNAGSGIAGIGWSLGGLSGISRCGSNYAQDAEMHAVDYTSRDRFCLDGQRLIATAGSYGANGTEYRTEMAGYAKIISHGIAGAGPAWFEVYTKSGQRFVYGNTADARVEAQGRVEARFWAVNTIEDAVGNAITFSYYENALEGVHYLTRIDYDVNSVVFEYEARPDVRSGYKAGGKVAMPMRLSRLAITSTGLERYSYRLQYALETAVQPRSRLVSLSRCDAALQCLPPTRFDWVVDSGNFTDSIAVDQGPWVANAYGGWNTSSGRIRQMDVNGDGLSDVVLGPNASGQWFMLKNTGTGFVDAGPLISGAYGAWSGSAAYIRPMDANGDGLTDIVLGPNASGQWFVLRNTGTAFVDEGAWATNAYGGWNTSSSRIRQMDVNRDGLPDIVLGPTAAGDWYLLKNTGTSFVDAGPLISGAYGAWSGSAAYIRPMDTNGDGLPDIVLGPNASGQWFVLKNTGTGFVDEGAWVTSAYGNWNTSSDYIRPTDVNGDGLPDIVLGPNASGQWFVLKNTGTGFVDEGAWATNAYGGWNTSSNRIRQMDVNGDGLPDMVLGPTTTGDWYLLKNTGTSFVDAGPLISGAYGAWSGSAPYIRPMDANGDGLTDIVLGPNASGQWFVLTSKSKFSPRLRTITDALGSQITIEYTPLTNKNIYVKGSNALYPNLDLQPAVQVVSAVSKTNGIGGVATTRYRYGGARAHILGRGYLGFAWDEVTDATTGITTRTDYNQDYPLTGMPKRTATRLASGLVISESDNTYTVTTTSYINALPTAAGGTRNQTYTVNAPYLSHKVDKTHDLDGSLVSTVTTDQANYDAYGNVGTVTVSTTAGGETYSKITTSTYDNDVANWHLGRLRTATVTHVHADGRQEVRKSAFEYDLTTGLLLKEIIEPDQPAFTQITTYQYDAFGNKVRATVSAGGLAGRTTSSSYDPSGRFATAVSNTLGHTETRAYGTYAHCGAADSLTGPNGLTTRWEYDSFCRKTAEIRADGTQSTITRDWADPATDTNAPTNAVYYVQQQSSGAPPVVKYFDSLGRAVRAVSIGFDGRAIYQDTVYDAQGRELKSSLPYYVGDTSYWVENRFDILGRVTRKLFNDGKRSFTTDYLYAGLTTTETNTLGQRKTSRKNAQGKVVRVDEEEGAYVTYQYDPVGNLTHTHQSDSVTGKIVTTRMGYDLRGRKIWMQDPDMSAAGCNPDLNQLAGCWTYQYNAFGELVSQTDAKGQTVSMVYDDLGRMVSRTEPEGTSTWTYDNALMAIGKLTLVEQRDTLGSLQFKQESFYDGYGRPGRTTTTIPNPDSTLNVFSSYVYYDLYGRVARTIQPGGFEVNNQYNLNGYLVAKQSPLPQVGSYDSVHLASLFDAAVSSAQAALVKADWYATQAAYFDSKATQYSGVIAAQAKVQQLVAGAPAFDDPRGYLTYKDAGGVLYAETAPTVVILHGAVATPILVSPEQHYKLLQDAGGQWAASLITNADWLILKPSLTADGNKLHVGDFDANGIRDFRHIAANSIDPLLDNTTLNKLSVLTADIRQAARVLANRADNALALAQQLVVAAANVRDRERQAQYWATVDGSELNQMAADANAGMVTWWRATARDAAGRLSAHRLGNGLVDLRDYDPANGHLNTIQTGFGFGSLVRHLEYEYDRLNNVTTRYDDIQDVREAFGYDRLNRLIRARVSGYAAGVNYDNTITYAYDGLGNMTYKSDVGDYLYGDSAKGNLANAGPHAVSRTGITDDYVYDDNGSITQTNGRNITWTSFNKPYSFDKAGTVVKFDYGPSRARFKKTVGGTVGVDKTTLYIGKGYERTEDSAGNVTHKYFIHTEDGLTAIHIKHEDSAGSINTALDETRYLHRDALGSIDTITDGQGNVVERMGYSAFGARRNGNWTTLGGLTLQLYTNRGFTGHEHIEEMGLIHMNGRVYDAEIGRFLSADPYVQSAASSQSFNRYSYVMNNPLIYTDPSGYFSLKKSLKRAIGFARKGLKFTHRWSGNAYGLKVLASNPVLYQIAYAVVSYYAPGWGPALLSAAVTYTATGSVTAGLRAGVDGYAYSYFGPVGAGVYAEVRGGKFIQGFGASAASTAGSYVPNMGSIGNFTARVVVGGVSAEIGGGKFVNGAASGAFSYMYEKYAGRETGGDGRADFEEGEEEVQSNRVSLRETEQERMLRENGDVTGYYMARLARGDNYAATALNVVMHEGIIGERANIRLAAFARNAGVSYDEYSVNVALMNAHARFVAIDTVGVVGLLSGREIAKYHHQVFGAMGLPTTTFGGTPLTGGLGDVPFSRFIGGEFPFVGDWCKGCDSRSSL